MRVISFVSLCSLIFLVGCGNDEPIRGEITGTVTTQGSKLNAGSIKFHPKEGPPLSIDVGFEGTFRITTMPPGEYVVTIETAYLNRLAKMGSMSAAPPEKGKAPPKANPRPAYVMVPAKYEKKESTTLKATINGGPQVIDFDCP
jgi:hypothetical protein